MLDMIVLGLGALPNTGLHTGLNTGPVSSSAINPITIMSNIASIVVDHSTADIAMFKCPRCHSLPVN